MPTLTLQPDESDPTCRDTYIADAVFVNNNYGSDLTLSIGTQNSGKTQQILFHTILRFDVTALAGATILDATLTMTASHGSVTGDTFNLHRLTQPNWTEFGANYTTTTSAILGQRPAATTIRRLPNRST